MEPELNLTTLATECEGIRSCPTVHLTRRATLVVQGPDATQTHGLRLGPGELAVELSVDLVREAIGALDNG